MEKFVRFLSLLIVPLTIINLFGGIVSGIWLAILGEWGIIGSGILAIFISGIALGLVMGIGLIFAIPAGHMLEKGNKIGGYFFGFLSTLYTVAILIVWCMLVLLYYVSQATPDSIIPVLIWSYGVAIGPIVWLAKKDIQSGSEYATITTFFVEVAYIISILGILFVGVSLLDVIIVFVIIMMVGMIIQFSMAHLIEKSGSHY